MPERKLGEDAPYRYEVTLTLIVGADGMDVANTMGHNLSDKISGTPGVIEAYSTVKHRNDLDHSLADA